MKSDTAKRRRNPRGEGDRLREELLAAAGRLLAESGDAEQLSLRGVAAAVGIAAPSIYRHFPDKAALLAAVVEKEFAEFSQIICDAAEAMDDPFEALRVAGHTYLRFGLERPGAYRVLFGCDGLGPADERPDTEAGKAAFDMLVGLLADCLAVATDPDAHPSAFELAVEAWVLLHGLVDLRIAHGKFPWPDPLERAVDQWLDRFRLALAGR